MFARVRSFVRNVLSRDRVERDLDDELQAALDLLVDEELEKGKSPADARRAALLTLGGIESVKVQVRDVRSGAFLDTLMQDLRYGARTLVHDPVFTLTAVLSVAIGIGATTTIFTLANGLLLRSAAGVRDPGSLVDVVRVEHSGAPGVSLLSYPEYADIRRAGDDDRGSPCLPALAGSVELTGRHWRRRACLRDGRLHQLLSCARYPTGCGPPLRGG